MKTKFLLAFLVILVAAFASISCSTTYNEAKLESQSPYSWDKSVSFIEKDAYWRVDLNKNDIAAVYKDGKRIPDNEINDYKEMIERNISELKSGVKEYSDKVKVYKFDTDNFTKDMEKFKEDMKEKKFHHFKFEFDDEAFKEQMQKLEEEMEKLKEKKFEINFDEETLKAELDKVEENLKDLPEVPNIDIHINMDEMKENMEKLKEEMKNYDFRFKFDDSDMQKFKEDMKKFKEDMKGFKVEVKGFTAEMKKFKSFINELKDELVKDGYLTDTEEDYSLEMSASEMKVNDKNVKQADFEKYKELYKDHFNKELDDKIIIENE